LRNQNYDLVILSAWLSDWEKGRILSAAGKTPTYVLAELMLSRSLLAEVKRMLPPMSERIARED
jgi:hypothetical protein